MKRALLALVLATAAACAVAAPAKPVKEADEAGLASAARLVHETAQDRRLILLGEMHGTREAPRLLAKLASTYAAEGPLVVALELSNSVQPGIDRYLASDGSTQARMELLAESWWHKPREQSDGRRNVEVLALFDHVRALRAQGRRVQVLAIDNPAGGAPGDRNEYLAARVRTAYSALPGDAHLLVLTGNAHAMLERPSFAPPEMPAPMGSYLRDLRPWSVDVAAASGQHWACLPAGCQAVDESGVFSLSAPVGDGSFDYRLVLARFSLAELIQ